MLGFGATELIFSQIPNFDKMSWLSIVAAVMSISYSGIGLGLGIAKAAGRKIHSLLTTFHRTSISVVRVPTWLFWRRSQNICWSLFAVHLPIWSGIQLHLCNMRTWIWNTCWLRFRIWLRDCFDTEHGPRGTLGGLDIGRGPGEVALIEKLLSVANALGNMAFAYSFSTILITIQVSKFSAGSHAM